MGRPRTWTEDRDASLIAMKASGMRATEIAAAMNATEKAVNHRVRTLRAVGAIPPWGATRWTPEKVQQVHALAEAGWTNEEIAAEVGSSKSAIGDLRFRYGIRSQTASPWSDEERAAAAKLAKRGLSGARIAEQIGRSRSAVRMELWRQRKGA